MEEKIYNAIGLATVKNKAAVKMLLKKYGINPEYLNDKQIVDAMFSIKNNANYNNDLALIITPYLNGKSNFSLDPIGGIIGGLGDIANGVGNIINGKDQAAAQIAAAQAAERAAEAKSAANIKIAMYISGAVLILGIVALVIYKKRKK